MARCGGKIDIGSFSDDPKCLKSIVKVAVFARDERSYKAFCSYDNQPNRAYYYIRNSEDVRAREFNMIVILPDVEMNAVTDEALYWARLRTKPF